MKNINSFWKAERPTRIKEVGQSLTVQDQGLSIKELLSSGDLDSIQERIVKRQIYGHKVRFEDLTKLDYYKNKLERYNNLMATKAQQEINKFAKETPNDVEPPPAKKAANKVDTTKEAA